MDRLIGRTRRTLRWYLGLTVLLGPVLALIPFNGGTNQLGWVLAGILGGGLGVFALAQWLQIRRVRWRLSAFARGKYLIHWTFTPEEWRAFAEERGLADPTPGEVFIGPQAGFCGGEFVEWNVLGANLEKVVLHVLEDRTPERLELVIHRYGPRAGQDWRYSFWVPVPVGKGAEAREFFERLTLTGPR
jgi:hypothetical protein